METNNEGNGPSQVIGKKHPSPALLRNWVILPMIRDVKDNHEHLPANSGKSKRPNLFECMELSHITVTAIGNPNPKEYTPTSIYFSYPPSPSFQNCI
ncbi:hypothetical protein CEXT_672631 [Caerostris extrusa]|uniref:Uncharacterized protein n=1 Tax=Caerostris extrusa TaxID=172846 RepID=A0AAV4M729_CAEEX|nr:hypothetical protein CEXT_672631 [Caerostris extrusa]